MQVIEIDFDVFKALTTLRASEEVTYNDVLRKLLGLEQRGQEEPTQESKGIPWTVKGVSFPHGTEFRANYKGRSFSATVEKGALVLNGKRFTSPSPAAESITSNPVNGWTFWECRLPGQNSWQLITVLRKRS